ncbi:MAG: hypothetical protein N3E37_01245 [Candidatus Micrarchaeota archaeon]|nr:hypothetical protein [Candidatus Micrarchaeota archaeon]
MGDIELDELAASSANMEIRYVTLELMKIALKKKKSFKQITNEYLRNAEYLKRVLTKKSSTVLVIKKRIRKELKDEESKNSK